MIEARDATFVTFLPEGHKLVGMTVFRDRLYVATNLGLFRLSNNKLVPVRAPIGLPVFETVQGDAL